MRAPLALAVVLAIGAAGCGKRGDPLPPLQRIPTATNKPRVSQQGQEIVIVWETPVGTVDGGALELTGAEVLRRVLDPPPPESPAAGEEAPSGQDGSADSPVEDEPVPSEDVESVQTDETDETDETGGDDPSGETDEVTTEQMEEDAEAPLITVSAPRQAGFASEAKVVARIEGNEPGERLVYRDAWDPAWEGKRIEYAVRHVNSKGIRSKNSDRSFIEPLPPVPAPSGFGAVAANGFVRLTWSSEPEPEPTSEDAVDLDFQFNVYRRRDAAESYPLTALNRQPLETTSFEDRNVEFRRQWCYVVRRVAVRRLPEPSELPAELAVEPGQDESGASPGGSLPPAEDLSRENIGELRGRASNAVSGAGGRRTQRAPEPPALIESEGAEEVCLTPIDTFAPAAPEGLVALGVPAGILLSWSESEASDVVGYRIYRSEQRGGPFEPLTPELVDVPSFSDRELTQGTTYFYAVSAVDGAEPPNESPRSTAVAAQAPE